MVRPTALVVVLLWRGIVAAAAAACDGPRCDGGDAWIVEPRSGSIVRGPDVDVEIALRPGGGGDGAPRSACLATSRVDDDPRRDAATRACFDVTLPSGMDANSTAPLLATASVRLAPDGWFAIDLSLRGGPAADDGAPVLSQFAVAVAVEGGGGGGGGAEAVDGRPLGLAWDWGGGIGWGVAGMHIALALADATSGALPVPLGAVHAYDATLDQRSSLAASVRAAARLGVAGRYAGEGSAPRRGPTIPFPVVHALGRWGVDGSLGSMDESLWSSDRNVGILFAETLDWSAADLGALARFDAVLVGSSWLGAGIEAAAAAEGVEPPPLAPFMQGVDAAFRPASGVLRGQSPRFRIFSGGKLEWRKGQDIVVEAVKRFRRARPEADAELVVSWANPWRVTMLTIENATHTRGSPALTDAQRLEANATTPLPKSDADHERENEALLDWLEANGLDRRDVLPLIPLAHRRMPNVLRTADAALFPNRAEGGTNLVAMEAVAAGVPSILARSTGQVDLVDFLGGAAGCWPLTNVTPSAWSLADGRVAGDEADPAEAARALIDIYDDWAAARRRALAGAKRMRAWTWPTAVRAITAAAFPER